MSELDEIEADELRQQARWERQYAARLAAHPDPRDPDYPGDRETDPLDD